jgi:hypothetical protein
VTFSDNPILHFEDRNTIRQILIIIIIALTIYFLTFNKGISSAEQIPIPAHFESSTSVLIAEITPPKVYAKVLTREEIEYLVSPYDWDKDIAVKEYAKSKVVEKWGIEHWESFYQIVEKESGWNHLAKNPKSSALGLMQTLSGTEKDYGCKYRSLIATEQIDCGIMYIEIRYGNPNNAYQFWLQNYWY